MTAMPQPHWGIKLDHWTFEGSETLAGSSTPLDRFCIARSYHIIICKDVPGEPGYHMSCRPFCSQIYSLDPTPTVPRRLWYRDIKAAFKKAGVPFEELRTSPAGVTHFHEKVPV